MQYFASFEPFEVFDEFNGVPGTYIKSFLISDKINLNKWQATHEANIANLDSSTWYRPEYFQYWNYEEDM